MSVINIVARGLPGLASSVAGSFESVSHFAMLWVHPWQISIHLSIVDVVATDSLEVYTSHQAQACREHRAPCKYAR